MTRGVSPSVYSITNTLLVICNSSTLAAPLSTMKQLRLYKILKWHLSNVPIGKIGIKTQFLLNHIKRRCLYWANWNLRKYKLHLKRFRFVG
jgi:hypothetical protein